MNHAFPYGMLFVTYAQREHKPEIGYLVPGENGLMLERNQTKANTDLMVRLLTDDAWVEPHEFRGASDCPTPDDERNGRERRQSTSALGWPGLTDGSP